MPRLGNDEFLEAKNNSKQGGTLGEWILRRDLLPHATRHHIALAPRIQHSCGGSHYGPAALEKRAAKVEQRAARWPRASPH